MEPTRNHYKLVSHHSRIIGTPTAFPGYQRVNRILRPISNPPLLSRPSRLPRHRLHRICLLRRISRIINGRATPWRHRRANHITRCPRPAFRPLRRARVWTHIEPLRQRQLFRMYSSIRHSRPEDINTPIGRRIHMTNVQIPRYRLRHIRSRTALSRQRQRNTSSNSRTTISSHSSRPSSILQRRILQPSHQIPLHTTLPPYRHHPDDNRRLSARTKRTKRPRRQLSRTRKGMCRGTSRFDRPVLRPLPDRRPRLRLQSRITRGPRLHLQHRQKEVQGITHQTSCTCSRISNSSNRRVHTGGKHPDNRLLYPPRQTLWRQPSDNERRWAGRAPSTARHHSHRHPCMISSHIRRHTRVPRRARPLLPCSRLSLHIECRSLVGQLHRSRPRRRQRILSSSNSHQR